MNPVIAVYREFAPHAALQPYIRAVFSFIPGAEDGLLSRTRTSEFLAFGGDATCPPVLADGHACLSFTLGEVCHADGRWRAAPARYSGHIVGAMTHADFVRSGEAVDDRRVLPRGRARGLHERAG